MTVTTGAVRSLTLLACCALEALAGGCGGGGDHGASAAHGSSGGHGADSGHGSGGGHGADGGHGAAAGHASRSSGFETNELLELLQEDFRRHDPQGYSELDLGEFRVTRSLGLEEGTLQVRFHLYGVLSDDKMTQFKDRAAQYDSRLRDAVLSLVQSCDLGELATPRLGSLKSQLTRSINEMLRTRSLRDVVFSELTIERG
jgi:hypothetical protein